MTDCSLQDIILAKALTWRSPSQGDILLGQIILFLLFIGAEKIVNRIAKRPLMNGAGWYLVAAPIAFVIAFSYGASAISAQKLDGHPGVDDVRKSGLYGQLMGNLCGGFLLPVGAAIYYSRKFSKAKEAASGESPQPTA